jgi:hypothetical protein
MESSVAQTEISKPLDTGSAEQAQQQKTEPDQQKAAATTAAISDERKKSMFEKYRKSKEMKQPTTTSAPINESIQASFPLSSQQQGQDASSATKPIDAAVLPTDLTPTVTDPQKATVLSAVNIFLPDLTLFRTVIDFAVVTTVEDLMKHFGEKVAIKPIEDHDLVEVKGDIGTL